MTAEGTFPKIAGDIIYASELNRFATAGTFLAMGSTILSTSGTANQVLGSILVPGGSLTHNCQILMNMQMVKGQADTVTIGFSGLSDNFSLSAGSTAGTSIQNGLVTGYLGSPLGHSVIFMTFTSANNSIAAINRGASSTPTSFDAGSPFIISIEGTYDSATSQIFYGVQGFRGAVS